MNANDIPLGRFNPSIQGVPDVPRWDDVEILSPLFNDSLLATRRDEVHRLYADLALYRPVFRDASGTWVISHHAIGARILADRNFPSGPPVQERTRQSAVNDLILLRDDDQHARLRQWYAPLFQSRHLNRVHAFVEHDIDRILRQLPTCTDIDFIAHVARVITGRAACVFMGLDPSLADRLVLETWPILPLVIGMPMREDEEAALLHQARPTIARLTQLIKSSASRCPDSDVASVLSGEPLRDTDAAGWNSVFMFAAAYATNLLTLGNIVRQALRIDEVWRRLIDEPQDAQAIVSELMRLDPAVHGIQRYVAQDSVMGQYAFRQGESVFIMVGAINRDFRIFDQPEQFRPGRHGKALTFGNGPHSCMGAGLARRLLANVLTAVARRWPVLARAGRAECGLQLGVFAGYASLWMKPRGSTPMRHHAG